MGLVILSGIKSCNEHGVFSNLYPLFKKNSES
jgi:hypothetical protein